MTRRAILIAENPDAVEAKNPTLRAGLIGTDEAKSWTSSVTSGSRRPAKYR